MTRQLVWIDTEKERVGDVRRIVSASLSTPPTAERSAMITGAKQP